MLTKGKTMNNYGMQIRDRWARTAPSSYHQLEDPDSMFEQLGNEVAVQVEQLTTQLAGPDPVNEPYLQKTGRLNAARKQAEELALTEIPWPREELAPAEERQDWEAATPSEAALVAWADSIEGTPFQDQIEAAAETWMLPTEFLEDLATASNPSTFLAENSATLRRSRDRRYQRDHSL